MGKTITFVIASLCIMTHSVCDKVKEEDKKVYAFSNEGNVWMASTYINVRFDIDVTHLLGILNFAKKMKATLDGIPYVQNVLALKDELNLETLRNISPAKGMVSNLFDKILIHCIVATVQDLLQTYKF